MVLQDNRTEMLIIMPREIGDLKKIEQMSKKFTNDYFDELGSIHNVLVTIPMFKIESSIDLKEPIKKVYDNQYYFIVLRRY